MPCAIKGKQATMLQNAATKQTVLTKDERLDISQ